jgi:hypothetical protein
MHNYADERMIIRMIAAGQRLGMGEAPRVGVPGSWLAVSPRDFCENPPQLHRTARSRGARVGGSVGHGWVTWGSPIDTFSGYVDEDNARTRRGTDSDNGPLGGWNTSRPYVELVGESG